MNWKNIKLKGKLTIAFGFLISIMIGAGIWAISGFNTIISNAEKVIDGNNLRYELNQHYVNHLVWTQQLNSLLTDKKITEVDINTDYRNCNFGKWYYGKGRKEAEKTIPELKSIFQQIEQPHKNLHASAEKIIKLYNEKDWEEALMVKQVEVDHLLWMDDIKDAVYLNSSSTFKITNNTTLYEYNKWINSDGFKKMKRGNSEISTILSDIEKSNKELSQSANIIIDFLNGNKRNGARLQFKNELLPVSKRIVKNLTDLSDWFNVGIKEMEDAKQIYANETLANLGKLEMLFTSAIENSKAHITNDRAMITQANESKNNIFISIIFVAIIASILAALVAKSIINPLQKSVSFANKVSKGDLTASVDLDQKDEVGELANSLRKMISKIKDIISNIKEGSDKIASASKELSTGALQISSGVSEQAASAEEVSSSMEQMASNIQQNSANAMQTKDIAGKSSVAVKNVVNASSESMEAVREIFGKINIVVEIAEKTDLLAINAAVEAARAGEQGRGFAVVAAEVRKLAERSQIAANEIVSLAQNGMKLTEQSNEMLNSKVPDIQETSRLIEEIATASREQESGVDQVNVSIQQLSMVTQQNASSSEEMASNSEELFIQADELDNITQYFTIDTNQSWKTECVGNNKDEDLANNKPSNISAHKQAKNKDFNLGNFEVETAGHEVF